MKASSIWVSALAMSLTATAAPAAQSDEAAEPDFPHQASDLPVDENVVYGELENGLRYAILENDTPTNTAALRMWIDMGALMEADDQRGLAHFIEHMAFNGSENVPEGDMVKILERTGLAFGPDTNAYTSFDETVYQLDLPETDEETLDTAFFLMSELDDLTMTESAIDNERGVVLSEKRVRNTPSFRNAEARYDFLFPDALAASRFPIGTEEVLSNAQRERFVDLYRKYYRPERAFFVAVGDFDAAEIEERIREAFGDWTVEGAEGPEPDLGGVGDRALSAGYFQEEGIPTSIAINVLDPYEAKADTLENRIEQTRRGLGNAILSRRFATISRQEDAPFLSASAGQGDFLETASIASVSAVTEPEKWGDALGVIENELRRAREFGFSQAELDEQIANMRTAYRNAAEQADTRQSVNLANSLVGSFSGDDVFVHPRDAYEIFEANADALSLEAVETAFREQWEGETPLLYLSTSQTLEEPEAEILDAYRAAASQEVEPREDDAAAEFAYQDFGEVGEVISREVVEDPDITRIRFANNVMLNFKQTDFEDDAVRVRMRFGGGALETPQGEGGQRFLFSNAYAQGGLGEHSFDEIQRLMAGKSVGLSFGATSDSFQASARTTPSDLEAQLELWAAYMTDPAYRPESLAQFQQLYRIFYKTLGSTPQGVMNRDVTQMIHSGDTRFGFPDEEEVETWSLDDSRAFIEPARQNAALEIGIVGDITEKEAVALVARTLGAIPERAAARSDFEDVRTVEFPETGETATVRHEGEADRALALVYWPAPDGQEARRARHMSLLAEIFQLKLTERVREQEAATYSPNAYYTGYRTYPGYGYFRVMLDLKPEDVDPFFEITEELAADMREGRFTGDELDRARRPLLENIEENQEQNGYWIGVVSEAQTDDQALMRHRTQRADYEDVTLETLKSLAAGQFDSANEYRVQILPPEAS